MKAILMAVLAFAMSTALWAQEDCSEAVTYQDKGCSTDANCPPSVLANCTNYSFTPSCTGDYTVDAWTTCDTGNCGHCQSCVLIYSGTFLIASFTQDNCPDSCKKTCGSVSLTANNLYYVKVCLSYCPSSDDDCEGCGDSCIAWGCLRYGQTAPCWL